jgi:hypothetical protein
MMAAEALLSDGDNYYTSNNYRIYWNPSVGRWFFIPTGIDQAFGGYGPTTVFGARGLLFQKCLASERCTRDYADKVRDVADRFEGLGLPAKMDTLLSVIDAASQADPKKNYDAATMTAARAAIVMPAVFAFADTVIGQPQTSIFAAFGSFAVLVLVDVEGPPLPRLYAYVALAAVGTVFITLGTVCSRNAWLGAGVMAVIGFCVLMSGVINGYVAALSTGALLLFVLPVTIPAPNSAISDRLEGWALTAGVGICAVMLLWPTRRRADLQHDAAGAMRAVARVAAAPDGADENLRVARDAVDRLGRRSLGSQHRPTGPTGPKAALAALPDELDWLLSFLGPPVTSSGLASGGEQDVEAMAATAAVLLAGAGRLDGRDERPDFERLDVVPPQRRNEDGVSRAHLGHLRCCQRLAEPGIACEVGMPQRHQTHRRPGGREVERADI